jgi:SAM-dependent methyltransferase
MTYTEDDIAGTIDRLLGDARHRGPLTPAQLAGVDQFHVGGAEAVDRLLPALALSPTSLVLDVGSGFGGPARLVAARTGAHVHGIDITRPYVDAATQLTARCGLDELVTFEHTDVAGHTPARPYDAVLTIHVEMNVADKAGWYRAIADRLTTGGRLAIWDVCLAGDGPLPWPMPWSIDGSDSHLVTAAQLRGTIEAAGLVSTEWVDETPWVNDWFTSAFAAAAGGSPALPMILHDGFTRILNFAGALADGTLMVVRGAFVTVG